MNMNYECKTGVKSPNNDLLVYIRTQTCSISYTATNLFWYRNMGSRFKFMNPLQMVINKYCTVVRVSAVTESDSKWRNLNRLSFSVIPEYVFQACFRHSLLSEVWLGITLRCWKLPRCGSDFLFTIFVFVSLESFKYGDSWGSSRKVFFGGRLSNN